jgi:hypothetical protein
MCGCCGRLSGVISANLWVSFISVSSQQDGPSLGKSWGHFLRRPGNNRTDTTLQFVAEPIVSLTTQWQSSRNLFKKFRNGSWNVAMPRGFSPSATTKGERTTKKISCLLAALATIAVAAPTVASAEGFSFRVGGDRDYYRDRDDYRGSGVDFYQHDRGLHRGWYDHDGE